MHEFIMHLIIIKDVLTNECLFSEKAHKKSYIAQEMIELLKDAAGDVDLMDLVVLDFDPIMHDWMEDKIEDQVLIDMIDDIFDEVGVADLVNTIITNVNRSYKLQQIGEQLLMNPIIIDET